MVQGRCWLPALYLRNLCPLLCCGLLISTSSLAQPVTAPVPTQQEQAAAKIVTLVADADAAIAQTQYDVAAGKLTMAYNLLPQAPDFPLERNVINSLASLYYSSEQYSLAGEYFGKLVAIDEASGDEAALAVSLFNLGHVVASLQEFAIAEQFLQRSLDISRKLGDDSGVAYANKALGVNAQAAGSLPQAQLFLVSALAEFTTLGDTMQRAAVLRNLADVELALKQPQSAVEHYQQAVPLMLESGLTSGLIRAYRGLSQAYEELQDLPNALIMQRTYAELLQTELQQQSLASTQRLREELDLRRHVDANIQLEQQTTIQQTEINNKQRLLNYQLAALTLAFVVIGLLGYMFRRSTQLADRMHTLATTDELTGLLNRRAIMKHGKQEWMRALRYQQAASCLVLDVDHFKSINDTWGHAKGDEVLKAISQALLEMLRQTDALGRVGGEEFLLVTSNTSIQHAQVLAERIRKRVSEVVIDGMDGRQITISIGLAAFHKDQGFEHCVQQADKALYLSKRNGRDRWTLYQPNGLPFVPAVAQPQLRLV